LVGKHLKIGERLETLTKLGLTFNQARAYLALSQFGPAGAKKLSEVSKITRQDIYRVMISLETAGIVEKLISKPTVYKAVPMRQGTEILLARKNVEYNDLLTKTRELVREAEKRQVSQKLEALDATFVIVPGKEAIVQKLAEALEKTQRSLEVVTSRFRFSPAILEFKDKYENALRRGVRIRITTEKHETEKAVQGIVQNLMANGEFEVRCFSDEPEAVVSIFDGKEASFTMSDTAHTQKASALWSNDLSFVAVTQAYFNQKWDNSTRFSKG
jgi:HTH-type transcriptional regulator, sugar sensing transcriptional regulator